MLKPSQDNSRSAFAESISLAKPNAGHMALADLEHLGVLKSIITQNVDNLHQASGMPDDKVIEIHGNASYAKCLQCGKRYEFETLKPRWEEDEDLTCIFCTGLLKNATVSFGQSMPEDKMLRASEEALLCDLVIVLGSSLVVYPASAIPMEAKRNGARMAIINREPTDQDPFADLVLHTEIGSLMTDTMALLDR